jgi:hypothetical protein
MMKMRGMTASSVSFSAVNCEASLVKTGGDGVSQHVENARVSGRKAH